MVTAGILPFRENSRGRTGNRTRDLMISRQRLWPLDHEAGLFNILWGILFTVVSPTCFGRFSDHLQGNILITRTQLWLNVSPSLHNNKKINNFDYIVNHNCILVIRISHWRWPEHHPKHVDGNIVNNIHHRILKCIYWLIIYFWIRLMHGRWNVLI